MAERLGILVGAHGRGSNMAAIAGACRTLTLKAQVGVVICHREESGALARANELGLTTAVVPAKPEADYGQRLVRELQQHKVSRVCLAGYMRLLPGEVLDAFPDRILNIHPALLPRFGGKGMYGIHVHQAVIAAKETESGCTVHRVNERYDEGEIVLQLRCPVHPQDTPEELAARVLELEHEAYPRAIAQEIARGG